MYDFHKVSRKENMLTFRNEIFHRGNDRNFHFIHRKRKAAKEDAIYEQEFQ